MVQTAWEEERAGVPFDTRKCLQMVLIGQGGTGKTMLVTEMFIPLVKWAFPPTDEGDTWDKGKVDGKGHAGHERMLKADLQHAFMVGLYSNKN